jgi:hypothetical protein
MSIDNQTKFATEYVPLNWAAQLAMFGRTVAYTPRDSDEPVELDVVWKEGAEDEPTSPGSYSNITVFNDDLDDGPAKGDAVVADGATFDVVRVDAYAIGYSRCVLKERT